MKRIMAFLTALTAVIGLSSCDIDISQFDVQSYPFEVHYIDVGQADAALVVCEGEAMMIDGGNVDDSSLIAAYLRRENIDKLKYVVCTHAHEDHVGGLSAALATVPAECVYAPDTGADTKAYKNFKRKVKEQGLTLRKPEIGESVMLGSADIDFLGPVNESKDDLNNTSVMLKITYGNTSFLFTGDAEREEEEDVLSQGAYLKSTVLKVGHHGSSSSTSYPFLRAVMPLYAVISCEKGNSYGHPHKETISKLSDAGVDIYRTDESGTVIMLSDGEQVIPITEK